mgnify:CR=1 FL=1
MGLFFYTKKGSIISTVDLPTTEIIEPFFHRFRIVLAKEYRFGIISYNMIILLYNVSISYTKIDYGQFQLILKIDHSLFFEDFCPSVLIVSYSAALTAFLDV